MQNQFNNQPAVDWAKVRLRTPIEIKPIASSGLGQFFLSALIFSPGIAFIALGLGVKILASYHNSESNTAFRALACGFVLLIPSGIILLLGRMTRAKFAKILREDCVIGPGGRKYPWSKLYFIDHVSKHYRAGGVSRVIKDNQLELVFENGKAIIPPMIPNREQIWELINSIPVQVRDDGVIRGSQ